MEPRNRIDEEIAALMASIWRRLMQVYLTSGAVDWPCFKLAIGERGHCSTAEVEETGARTH